MSQTSVTRSQLAYLPSSNEATSCAQSIFVRCSRGQNRRGQAEQGRQNRGQNRGQNRDTQTFPCPFWRDAAGEQADERFVKTNLIHFGCPCLALFCLVLFWWRTPIASVTLSPMETAAHPRFLFKPRTFGMMFVTLTSSATLRTDVVKTYRRQNFVFSLRCFGAPRLPSVVATLCILRFA